MKSIIALALIAAPAFAHTGSHIDPVTGQKCDVEACSKKVKAEPGETVCNNDGVCVANDPNSTGDAYIDPGKGHANSATTITTKSGFTGDISGMDANDTANLGSNATATVTGEGGTVNVSGGSTVTVSNTSTTGSTTVNMSSGTSVTIPAGSTATVKS